MRVIRPLEEFDGPGPSIFMAGGISGCPPWQDWLLDRLGSSDIFFLNPRRSDWPEDPAEIERQIEWEHRHLRKAAALLFWFPRDTLCPITLYELGSWSMTGKPLAVGIHPEYPRALDVRIQTRLARPEIAIVHSLEDLADRTLEMWTRLET